MYPFTSKSEKQAALNYHSLASLLKVGMGSSPSFGDFITLLAKECWYRSSGIIKSMNYGYMYLVCVDFYCCLRLQRFKHSRDELTKITLGMQKCSLVINDINKTKVY